MRVEVSFLGVLENQAGVDRLPVELPEGATFRDLLCQLDRLLGERLADWVWDRAQQSFTPYVLVSRNFVDVEDAATPLADGDEILVLSPMAGGEIRRRDERGLGMAARGYLVDSTGPAMARPSGGSEDPPLRTRDGTGGTVALGLQTQPSPLPVR